MRARFVKLRNDLFKFMGDYKQWGRVREVQNETEPSNLSRTQLQAALDHLEAELSSGKAGHGAMSILSLVCMVTFASEPALLEDLMIRAAQIVRICLHAYTCFCNMLTLS